MPNRYSNFPDMVDDIKRLSEIQEMTPEHKIKVARYTELALKNMTIAEEIEFDKLVQELKGYQLNSSDWNKLVEAVYNLHIYFKDVVLNDLDTFYSNTVNTITEMVDGIQIPLGNAKAEIETTKNLALNDMNSKVSQLISTGQIGFRFYDGRYTVQAVTNKIIIPIPEYNKAIDYLMVHVNGALIRENVNYTLSANGDTLTSMGGNWEVGTVFDFLVIKRTMVLNDKYDATLFEDRTIQKKKLEQVLQDEISKVNNKQDMVDKNLGTNSKEIVGSINEVNSNVKALEGVVEDQGFKIGDLKITRNPSSNWKEPNGASLPIASYQELFNILGYKKGDVITKTTSTYAMTGLTSGGNGNTFINYSNGVYYFYTYSTKSGSIGYVTYTISVYYSTDGVNWTKIDTSKGSYYSVSCTFCTSSILFVEIDSSRLQGMINIYFDTSTKTLKEEVLTIPDISYYRYSGVTNYYNNYGGLTLIKFKQSVSDGTWGNEINYFAIVQGRLKSSMATSDALYILSGNSSNVGNITSCKDGILYSYRGTTTSENIHYIKFSNTSYIKKELTSPFGKSNIQKIRSINDNFIIQIDDKWYLLKNGGTTWTEISTKKQGLVFSDIVPLDLIANYNYFAGYDDSQGWFISKISDMVDWQKTTTDTVDTFSTSMILISWNKTYMILSDGSFIMNPQNSSTRIFYTISDTTTFTLPVMNVPEYTYMKVR